MNLWFAVIKQNMQGTLLNVTFGLDMLEIDKVYTYGDGGILFFFRFHNASSNILSIAFQEHKFN